MGIEAPGKRDKPLDFWKAEIRAGIKYRTIFGRSREWSRFKNYYRGIWGRGTVPVNLVYAVGRSLVPQVYFRNPRISVYPMRPGYGMHARIWERIDNYIIRETGLKNELKSLVLDCYLCGRGPIIMGYDTEYGFNPSFMSSEFADSSLTSFNDKGERIEYSDVVKPGMPWALRCNPLDFVVPWGTSKWEDARWFAFRKMRTIKDIKEDPKYKNTSTLKGPFRSKLDADSSSRPEQTIKMHEDETYNEWVELWQIHDKRTGRVFVISLDHDKFLRDEVDYLQVEGLPAHVLGFNEDPDFFWWSSDVRQIEHQQLELNDIRTMAKRHRRVALLKVLYDKHQISKDELTKLLDEDPKAAVGIDAGTTGDIRKAIALFQSHVPPDLTIAAREVREDTREIIGFSRNQMGSFEAPSGRRTATEAGIVKQAAMIRIDERRDSMTDLLEKIIRTENQLVAENWTEERVVDVIGMDGAKYWVRFTGREIRGEFHYKINPEEAVPEDARTRGEEELRMMQLFKDVPGIDMKYLVESFASRKEWIDPKQLFPREGPGKSPEKAMLFQDFMRRGGSGVGSQFPGLGGS